MIHEILIIPAYGHSDDDGNWTPGHTIGKYHEVDLIDSYVASMIEEFEYAKIRYSVVNTRKHPGIRESARAALVEPNRLVLHCQLGWAGKERKGQISDNWSCVYYNQDTSFNIARKVSETIGQWGKCTCFSHAERKPRKVEDAILDSALAITIEPFALNLPGVDDYAMRLRPLGREIANVITAYLEGQASRSKAYSGFKT